MSCYKSDSCTSPFQMKIREITINTVSGIFCLGMKALGIGNILPEITSCQLSMCM